MLSIYRDETPTLIFNPTKQDFKCKMATDADIQEDYLFPSRQIITFPKYIADHIAKHLAQKIALENQTTITSEGAVKLHYEERYKRALASIFVTI